MKNLKLFSLLLLFSIYLKIIQSNLALECNQYRNRTKIPKELQQHPSLLWTFPGSGSGWVRLMIEHATSYYSGSVYGDESLLEAFPGEFICSPDVIIIKAHPTTHTFADLEHGDYNHRCTIHHIDKAILVIRNPFDAIWSDHNRKITRSHVGKILQKDFDRKEWVMNAKRLAYKYSEMWPHSYQPFIQKHPNGYLLIKYEELIDPVIQIEKLESIMKFLNQPYPLEKLKCAFYLANHPTVRRPVYTKDEVMKKSDAYTPGLVCELWNILKPAATRFGYSIYRNQTC